MDIKEIKFPDIQNTVNKPGCGRGAGSEPTIVPSGHHGQSNKIFDLQAAALITTLLRSPSYTEERANAGHTKEKQFVESRCWVNNEDDFDFEGNRALFDRAAVFSQTDGTNDNRVQHHSTPDERRPLSCRHDEHILERKPAIYRQITVPQHGAKNTVQGAEGISCSRYLANYKVEVILFQLNFLKMQDLHSRRSGKQLASVKDLPTSHCHENRLLREPSSYKSATDWANQNQAPNLMINPMVSEEHQTVKANWTPSWGLPLRLDEAESLVYLCEGD